MLGPLLFNIYINDIVQQIKSPVLQFADDLKMFCIINDAADYHQLQQDVNNLVAWANKWQLNFNVICCILASHMIMAVAVLVVLRFLQMTPLRIWVLLLISN